MRECRIKLGEDWDCASSSSKKMARWRGRGAKGWLHQRLWSPSGRSENDDPDFGPNLPLITLIFLPPVPPPFHKLELLIFYSLLYSYNFHHEHGCKKENICAIHVSIIYNIHMKCSIEDSNSDRDLIDASTRSTTRSETSPRNSRDTPALTNFSTMTRSIGAYLFRAWGAISGPVKERVKTVWKPSRATPSGDVELTTLASSPASPPASNDLPGNLSDVDATFVVGADFEDGADVETIDAVADASRELPVVSCTDTSPLAPVEVVPRPHCIAAGILRFCSWFEGGARYVWHCAGEGTRFLLLWLGRLLAILPLVVFVCSVFGIITTLQNGVVGSGGSYCKSTYSLILRLVITFRRDRRF